MNTQRMTIALAALAFTVQPLLAQDSAAVRRRVAGTYSGTYSPCPGGPGVAFGVTAYQCASCSFKVDEQEIQNRQVRMRFNEATGAARGGRAYGRVRADSGVIGNFSRSPLYSRPIFGFQSEPIVLEVAANSLLKAGDVIEAVNGEPITTRAGSDLFTYPPNGEYVIRVRRGGTRMDITTQVTAPCAQFRFAPAPREPGQATPRAGRGRGGGPPPSGQLEEAGERLSSEYAQRPRDNVDRANQLRYEMRYGFAVSCQPSCTRARARVGSDYYRFEGYPSIVTVLKGGVAEQAGLREGDRVIRIDGQSILEEDGALRFQGSARRETLRITVQRNGDQLTFLLRER
jgi:membrane-associated protease RseP (regulator of RpoE activity)